MSSLGALNRSLKENENGCVRKTNGDASIETLAVYEQFRAISQA